MHAITDLQAAAARRLPRRVFDFIAGGAGTETSANRNVEDFGKIRLLPRVLADIRTCSTSTRLLGRDYAAPLGISPMGMCNIAWPGTDRGLAAAARASGLPYCLSMAGSSPLAGMHEHAGEYLWYQIYPCGDDALWEKQFQSAERLGVEHLVLTLDVPVPGLRHRDIRNGFSVPMRWTPAMVLDFASHPGWSLATLSKGRPRMRNMESFTGGGGMGTIMAIFANAVCNWDMLHRLRARWKGKLIVKGVLHPEDARRIEDAGADGIVISNHGGRQLGAARSSIDSLPDIRRVVGRSFPLMLDSGIRNGEDIAKALALGANFVFAGRPFLYGAAALGPRRGPAAVIETLTAEFASALAQLGCTEPTMLSRDHVRLDEPRHSVGRVAAKT